MPETATKSVSDKLSVPTAKVKRRAPCMKGIRPSGKIADAISMANCVGIIQ